MNCVNGLVCLLSVIVFPFAEFIEFIESNSMSCIYGEFLANLFE